jgi:hypothetical protein
MTTPNYIKTAVNAYYEKGDWSYICRMFEQGIPLHCYQESRDLISKLIQGEKPRQKGRQPASASKLENRLFIAFFVAQLHGAGFPLTANGNKTNLLTAIQIASHVYNMKESSVRKSCWYPLENDERIKEQIKMGEQNKDSIRELWGDWIKPKVEN